MCFANKQVYNPRIDFLPLNQRFTTKICTIENTKNTTISIIFTRDTRL